MSSGRSVTCWPFRLVRSVAPFHRGRHAAAAVQIFHLTTPFSTIGSADDRTEIRRPLDATHRARQSPPHAVDCHRALPCRPPGPMSSHSSRRAQPVRAPGRALATLHRLNRPRCSEQVTTSERDGDDQPWANGVSCTFSQSLNGALIVGLRGSRLSLVTIPRTAGCMYLWCQAWNLPKMPPAGLVDGPRGIQQRGCDA